MTDDHTPVELGLAWKGSRSNSGGQTDRRCRPQVRFSVEPIDAEEVMVQKTNVTAALFMVSALVSANLADRTLFDDIYKTICSNPGDSRGQFQSQVFLGFDIVENGSVSVKAYFVLTKEWRSEQAIQPMVERVNRRIGSSSSSSSSSFTPLSRHLDSLPPHEKGFPIILSIDMVTPSNSRCKLYWRYPRLDGIKKASQHLHLPSDSCDSSPLWNSVLSSTLDTITNDNICTTSTSDHPTGGLLVYYDMARSEGKAPHSKAYFPIRHMFKQNQNESRLASCIASLLDDDGFEYGSTIASVLGQNGRLINGTHTYLCIELKKSRPVYSVYFKPCLQHSPS